MPIMKRLTLVVLAIGVLWVAWSAWRPVPGDSSPQKLLLTGSSTVAPLAAEIGRRYESEHPQVRVDVQTRGSSRGVNDVRRGLAEHRDGLASTQSR